MCSHGLSCIIAASVAQIKQDTPTQCAYRQARIRHLLLAGGITASACVLAPGASTARADRTGEQSNSDQEPARESAETDYRESTPDDIRLVPAPPGPVPSNSSRLRAIHNRPDQGRRAAKGCLAATKPPRSPRSASPAPIGSRQKAASPAARHEMGLVSILTI
jgi:hypothetical protein